MADVNQDRMTDAENQIDISTQAYSDLLALSRENPARKARIQIAGYG